MHATHNYLRRLQQKAMFILGLYVSSYVFFIGVSIARIIYTGFSVVKLSNEIGIFNDSLQILISILQQSLGRHIKQGNLALV